MSCDRFRQQHLFHVLAAYSMYNTEVGYCQGMSQIAAILLMYLDEEVSATPTSNQADYRLRTVKFCAELCSCASLTCFVDLSAGCLLGALHSSQR